MTAQNVTAERAEKLQQRVRSIFGGDSMSYEDRVDLLAVLRAHAAALRAEPAQCSRCGGRGTITYWDSQGSHEMPCLCQGAKAEPAGLPPLCCEYYPDCSHARYFKPTVLARYFAPARTESAGNLGAELVDGPHPAEPAPGEDERAIEKLEAWLPMGADKDKVILYLEARLASFAALKQERDELKGEVERLKGLLKKSGDDGAGILLHQAEVTNGLASDRVRLIADNNCLKARAETAEAALAGKKVSRGWVRELVDLLTDDEEDIRGLGLDRLREKGIEVEEEKEKGQ